MRIARRLENFQEYIFASFARKKTNLEKKINKKVLDLSIGSPDFPPSRKYINKLKEFIEEKKSHLYPGYRAIEELSRALINWYKKRFSVTLKSNELLPLTGAKDGIAHLPLALLDNKDEVLIPDPGYPGFSAPAIMIGAKPVYYNLTEKNNFKIDITEIEKKITDKTKFIWVNFPSNPTGQVATVKELKEIVNLAKKHKIWLVYDNTYSEITFDGYVAPSILEVNGAFDIAVEISSFSKTFSLAGYRMGWIAGNAKVINALAKVKSQYDSGLSFPLQKLGAYVLNHFDKKWFNSMIKNYELRRDKIIKNLQKIGLSAIKKKGSLYLWVKIPDNYRNSWEYCQELLEKKYILVAPGLAFGKNGERYVRVSISSNIKGIESYFN